MNQIKPMRTLAVFGILLATCRTLCADVALVADGKPVSEIVVPADATPSVRTAALELQRHLESMSGARLSIVTQASPDVAGQVYVGESDATRKLGVSLDDVKYDGFKIVAAKNHVILAGRQKYLFAESFSKFKDVPRQERQKAWEKFCGHKWRSPPIVDYRDFNKECDFYLGDATGTLYAAYELLGQLGMRWYMPVEEIGLVIPKLKDISIKNQSIKREPEFPVRVMTDSGLGTFKNEFLWYKSMKVGAAINMPVYHSLSGPLQIEPKEQPQEYYGVVNGKVKYDVPKLSGERLRADTVEYLEWVDKAFPGISYVSIGQSDGWSGMDAEDVAAGWDKLVERGEKGRYSDYWWDFFLEVRKRYLAKHTGKKFTTLAYGATKRLPTNLEKVPDDTTVVFTQSIAGWMLPNQELEFRSDWLSRIANKDQLLIWEYYIQNAFVFKLPPVPAIFTQLMRQSFSGLYDHAAGFVVEVGWNSEAQRVKAGMVLARPGISHLILYLHNRLCWDRNLDVPAVLDEYYRLFYGPAHAEMKEFFEFAESVWVRPEVKQISLVGGFLKQPDVVHYFDILTRAKAKAGDTIHGKRIDFIAVEMEPLKLLFEKLKRTGPDIKIAGTNNKPTINGDLDKPFWREQTHTFTALRDMMTGKEPKHVGTSVSFRWLNDNSALIVGIECREPKMDKLRESCKTPDSSSIFNDDTVEIRLETAKGIRPLIVVNPAGVIYDECVTENLADLPAFYKVSQSAVKKYADRWTVEVRIDAKPISGEQPTRYFPWGVNICRQRMAGDTPEHYMLSPSGTQFNDMKSMGNLFVR